MYISVYILVRVRVRSIYSYVYTGCMYLAFIYTASFLAVPLAVLLRIRSADADAVADERADADNGAAMDEEVAATAVAEIAAGGADGDGDGVEEGTGGGTGAKRTPTALVMLRRTRWRRAWQIPRPRLLHSPIRASPSRTRSHSPLRDPLARGERRSSPKEVHLLDQFMIAT